MSNPYHGPLSVAPGPIDDSAVRDDLLYQLLCRGEASAEDQRYAAGWIARLTAAAVEDILAAALKFAGDRDAAVAWYAKQPIPSFGDKTAAELVAAGQGPAVLQYLKRIGEGGYA